MREKPIHTKKWQAKHKEAIVSEPKIIESSTSWVQVANYGRNKGKIVSAPLFDGDIICKNGVFNTEDLD